MSPADVWTGLLALGGSSVFGAIVTGFWAYKTEAVKGRRQPMKPGDLASASGTYPGSHDIELLVHALSPLTAALVRANSLREFAMGPGQAGRFREWVEDREMRKAFEQIRRGHGAGHG